jgi:hypothetical protein
MGYHAKSSYPKSNPADTRAVLKETDMGVDPKTIALDKCYATSTNHSAGRFTAEYVSARWDERRAKMDEKTRAKLLAA